MKYKLKDFCDYDALDYEFLLSHKAVSPTTTILRMKLVVSYIKRRHLSTTSLFDSLWGSYYNVITTI